MFMWALVYLAAFVWGMGVGSYGLRHGWSMTRALLVSATGSVLLALIGLSGMLRVNSPAKRVLKEDRMTTHSIIICDWCKTPMNQTLGIGGQVTVNSFSRDVIAFDLCTVCFNVVMDYLLKRQKSL
jgi:hypothetical protein